MIDNCANCGIPARIIYLNYYSTTAQLVSEKTLLDETKTSNFCVLIVYVLALSTLITKRFNAG